MGVEAEVHGVGIRHLAAVGREKLHGGFQFRTEGGSVENCGSDADFRRFIGQVVRHYRGFPFVQIHLRGLHEPDVAVDAGAGIPTGVPSFVHGPYGDGVLLAGRLAVVRDVETVGRVAVRIEVDLDAVHPYFRLGIDPFEIEGDAFVLVCGGQSEGLAVPTLPAHSLPCGRSAGVVFRERADVLAGLCGGFSLDAPVVWQVQRAPGRVVEIGRNGFPYRAVMEFPPLVYAGLASVLCGGKCGDAGEASQCEANAEYFVHSGIHGNITF